MERAYKLRPDLWGRGYAAGAAAASVAFGSGAPELDKIVATVRKPNPESGRVMEKLGMHYERDVTVRGAEQRFYTLSLEQ